LKPTITLFNCCLILCVGICSCTRHPIDQIIGKDLGITFPKKYKIIEHDADPFGLGADAEITYLLRFDSIEYQLLCKSIEGSLLYNKSSAAKFHILAPTEKIEICKTLATNKQTAFWIKTDSNYVFDGDELFLDDPDQPARKAAYNNFIMPNFDQNGSDENGYPMQLYYVKAILDIKSHTLYYKYVHI
jgi:hypothetical protein